MAGDCCDSLRVWRIGELDDRVGGVRLNWSGRWGGAGREGVRECHADDEGFGSPVEGDEVRGKGGGGAAGDDGAVGEEEESAAR